MGENGKRWITRAGAVAGLTAAAWAQAAGAAREDWNAVLKRLIAVVESPATAHPAELAWADLNRDGNYTPDDVNALLEALASECLDGGQPSIICGDPPSGGGGGGAGGGPGGVIPPGPGGGGGGFGGGPGDDPPGADPPDGEPLVRILDLRIVRTAEKGGLLEEEEGVPPVGYLLVNSDDDNANGVADKLDVGPTARENDLVQIWISAYQTNAQTPPTDLNGWIRFPAALRIFRSAERTDEVLTTSPISMATAQYLYVEALEPGRHVIQVGGNQLGVWDSAELIAAEVVGPDFVPDLSTHSYEIQWTGPGPEAVQWQAEGAHEIDADAESATVLWGAGPLHARLWLRPTPDFKMPFDVRVIEVAVSGPDGGPAFESANLFHPFAGQPAFLADGTAFSATGFDTYGTPWPGEGPTSLPGFRWTAKVTLTGPDDDPAYGADKIRLGFVQNVTIVAYHALYFNADVTLTHSIVPAGGGPVTYLDCIQDNTRPWYEQDQRSWRTATSGQRAVDIWCQDSPGKNFPSFSNLGFANLGWNSPINACSLRLEFDLWVVASPTEDNQGHDSVEQAVSRQAWCEWWLLGSDVAMPQGSWDQFPAGHSMVVLPGAWTPTTFKDLQWQSFLIGGVTANVFEQTQSDWSE